MLYKTTREDNDTYTAHRALHENCATDGGVFVPFRMPLFSINEIADLVPGGFSATVATILNKFFSCHLTGWDVDFCIGRNSVKLEEMSHRMIVAELWHNPDGHYGHICSSLYNKLCESTSETVTDWFIIATHISVIFGIYIELCRCEIISAGDALDITTLANKLDMPMAALYARQMGLPIGTIILSCEENGCLWDMIHLGELTASASNTDPNGFERLVHATIGVGETKALRKAIHSGMTYYVPEDQRSVFNKGLFCSVVGKNRGIQNVNSIYRSNGYILDTATALTVAGLQDYRAKTGESNLTLVLACVSPLHCLDTISDATGMSQDKLQVFLKKLQDRRQ